MRGKDTPIAIVGAGAFGLSTAWHLLQSGYTNITVFDKDPEIPSRFSAANDLNKIVRAEYEDRFYTDLTIVGLAFDPGISDFLLTTLHRKQSTPGNPILSLPPTSTKPGIFTASAAMLHKRRLIHYSVSVILP